MLVVISTILVAIFYIVILGIVFMGIPYVILKALYKIIVPKGRRQAYKRNVKSIKEEIKDAWKGLKDWWRD